MPVTSEIKLASQDGVENRITVVEPEHESQFIVLCLPAMGVTAKQYAGLAQELSAQGLIGATVDLRGHGHSSIRPSREIDFSYAEMVQYDLPATIDALTQAFPKQKLILLGHSLGGQLASLYLAERPNNAAGLVLAASCSVYYKGWPWPASWSILLFSQIALLTARIKGYFPGHSFKFGGNEARGVMRDWAHNARSGRYRLSGSAFDYEQGMKTINVPVLALNFADDRFAPESATQVLLNKFGNDIALTKRNITAQDLTAQSADHFNWLKHPEPVAVAVKQWLNSTFK